MKRELNEQWVEVIDGKRHMVKETKSENSKIVCQRCLFSGGHRICNYPEDDCPVRNGWYIKDLGILNEDGCLPSEFGVYPEVYEHVLMGINGYMVKAYIQDPHVGKYAWGKTKQEAIDAWNRRM